MSKVLGMKGEHCSFEVYSVCAIPGRRKLTYISEWFVEHTTPKRKIKGSFFWSKRKHCDQCHVRLKSLWQKRFTQTIGLFQKLQTSVGISAVAASGFPIADFSLLLWREFCHLSSSPLQNKSFSLAESRVTCEHCQSWFQLRQGRSKLWNPHC